MANIITRRSILATGAGAAAVYGALGNEALAQINTRGADATAPNLPLENGATLRILRPVRFVQPDEDIFRANAARFTERSASTSSAGRTSRSRPRSPRIPARAPTSSSASTRRRISTPTR